jgi:hypothetical protein
MSILSTHLWGERRTVTPLSPVGERVARMRQARIALHVRWFILAYAFGKFFWLFVSSGVEEAYRSARFAPVMMAPGAGPVPAGVVASPLGAMLKALERIDWSVYVLFALMFTLFYWGLPWFARTMFDRSPEARSQETQSKRRKARRTHSLLLPFMCVAFGGIVIAGVVVSAMAGARVFVMVLGLPLSIIGPMLVAGALTYRRGARVVCARCDYPMTTWRGAPAVCPECGNEWKRPWAAMVGERRVRRGLVWCGVGLYGLALALPWVAMG